MEKRGHNFLDITGKRFGRLIAVKPVTGVGKTVWLCKCDCGNEKEILVSYLTSGDTKSCGCLKEELEEKHLREKYDDKRVDGVAMHLFGDEPRKDSKTGYRGVFEYRTRVSKQLRYGAWITVAGKRYYKKGFETAEDAYYNGRLKLEKEYLPKKDDKNDN